MTTIFNQTTLDSIAQNYAQGLLPQRNRQGLFYSDTSCRSNLHLFGLTSENRRILKKTNHFSYQLLPLNEFIYDQKVQKVLRTWVNSLGWDFPTSSIKTVFTNHIFNYIYVWKDAAGTIIAYSICYFAPDISHIAYVFYNPEYSHQDLPIRLVLQFIIDSHQKELAFAYLGRFSTSIGYYKRNLPGFEYFQNQQWTKI